MNKNKLSEKADDQAKWDETLQSEDGSALLKKMSDNALSDLNSGNFKEMEFPED